MKCEELQRRLAAGELTAEAEEHLRLCEPCAVLVARRLAEQAAGGLPDLEALRRGVEAQIAAERGPLSWLRSRATPWRRRLAAAAGLLPVLAVAVLAGRADLGRLGGVTLAVAVAYAIAYVVLIREALRPLHEPERVALRNALGLSALALPVLGALLCARVQPAAALAARHGCLPFGMLVALLPLGALRACDRTGHRGRGGALLAVAAAGVVANLALLLRCADQSIAHLLRWHVPAGFLLGLAYGLSLYLSREKPVGPTGQVV